MTTFSDDFIQLEFDGGTKRVACDQIGLDWPPPKNINVMGFDMTLQSHSPLTDNQRSEMRHVARGAVYKPVTSE